MYCDCPVIEKECTSHDEVLVVVDEGGADGEGAAVERDDAVRAVCGHQRVHCH